MKQITKTYNVYKYNELSEKAKEKAKEWYLNAQDPYTFKAIIEEDLKYLFPNSSLSCQFSLSYCQGDGFNIYGDLNLSDIFDVLETSKASELKNLDHFTEKEKRTLEFYNNYYMIKLPENCLSYSYCIVDCIDLFNDMIDELEYNDIRNINKNIIKRLENVIIKIFNTLCDKYESEGYKYFYEISDLDMIEYCEINNYLFYENGKIYQ